MSRFARRVYYLSAFLLFAVVGPLLVAWTAGYRWSNSRAGFIRTGSLTVASEPRANISLNGVAQGTTPWRATHVMPGTYVIDITKPGFGAWRREVAVSANVALTIGPVLLYPSEFSRTDITAEAGTILTSTDLSTVYRATKNELVWHVQSLWPTRSAQETILPFSPTNIARSRTGQTTVWQNSNQAEVTNKNQPNDPWIVEPVQNIQFDPSSEAVFYGLQHESVIRFDSLTRQQIALAPATSFTVVNDSLWVTQTTDTSTSFLRRSVFGQPVPDTLLSLTGRWDLVTGPPGTLLVHNATTRELSVISQSFGTSQFTTTSVGFADQWWWPDANQPPLWLDGPGLLTLNEKKQPELLDRLSASPTLVSWLVPGHILWSASPQRVAITSVSSRQGRGTILERDMDSPTQVFGLDLQNRRALLSNPLDAQTLTEIGW